MYYLIVIGVVLIDRLVKWLVVSNFAFNESVPIVDGLFRLTYIQNTGAAFSMFSEHTGLLAILTGILVIIGLVFLTLKKKTGNKIMMTGVAFILGGGIGNLYDRVTQGYVTDMFDLKSFAVFNVADIFVCGGCALLCIYVIFLDKKHEK